MRTQIRSIRAVFVVAVTTLAVFLSGQPVTASSLQLAQPATASATAGSATKKPAVPHRLAIPSIGVNAPLMSLGLNKDRSLQVPGNAYTAGWFKGAPRPGQVGPAVIAAHVHFNHRVGAFARLSQVKIYDRIIVTTKNGTKVAFVVTRVARFQKNRFPTKLVYGNLTYPGLRLITCEGFDSKTDTYRDNVVVFARIDVPRTAFDIRGY
jgi:sortase (surface protein transpeptidase)